jgi:hypothetical protein
MASLIMKQLTKKQKLFAKYLLAQLGFTENDFLFKYQDILEMVSNRYRMLGAIRRDSSQGKAYLNGQDDYKNYIPFGDYLIPEEFSAVDYLLFELKLKQQLRVTRKPENNTDISATDISNFTFCPISYAIAKTFETEKLESAQIGSTLHKTKRLLNYIRPGSALLESIPPQDEPILQTNPQDSFRTEHNEFFFKEINGSQLIFTGHDYDGRSRFFKSKKGNYTGQPDYIFLNAKSNQHFIVEEKFQFVPKDPTTFYENIYSASQTKIVQKRIQRDRFFENHINQVRSYLFGITDFDLKYGYLIYWKYELEYHIPVVVKCNILRVEKNNKHRSNLIEKFIELRTVLKKGGAEFDLSKLQPAKCANCATNMLCGHKTGKFNEYTIPYSEKYLQTYKVDFPPNLRR